MNIVSDPKSIPASSILSPEANQAAALATATGVLTVDLDAIVANWRKLEKAAVPAECAAVINAGDHAITLVMGHLPSPEFLNHPLNAKQLPTFREIASLYTGVPASLSNSSGIFLSPQFQFDLVRPGAALYGVNPTPEADNPMQPVVDLKARIVQIRNVERGDSVGYGGTWTARRPTRLAIVSAGYADGYFPPPRSNGRTRRAEVDVGCKRF